MMRKFYKVMLTLALVFGAVGVSSVKAAKVDWNPSSWVASWDGSTSTMSWNGSDGYKVMNTGFPKGDISAYGKIHYSISSITGDNDYIQLKVVSTGKSDKTINLTVGENDINFADYTSFINFTDVTEMTLWGTGSSDGTAVITDFYMESSTRTLNVDLSSMAASSGEAMWDKNTNTFSWKATWSNSIALPGLTGNLSAYTSINFVTATGTCDHFRIIVYLVGGVQKTWSGDVGTGSVTFASLGLNEEDLTAVSSINISGASDGSPSAGSPLSITVTSVSLEGPALNYIKASTVYTRPAGSISDLEALTGTYPSYLKWPDTFHYFESLGNATVFCGNGDGSSESFHVTIKGSDYICFDVIEATGAGQPLRVWIWDGSKVQTLYAYPIADYATATYSTSANVSSVGTYVTKVTGYDYLKGIKTNYGGGSIKISKAYTCSGAPIAYVPTRAYKLYGESTGLPSLTAALSDADACYYDATAVSGVGVTLDATNPNALFKANTGVLSNTKNVIVGSTCTNFELTDGKPFKAPSDFTATASSYSRAFVADKTTTVCLPFALTAAEASALGKFYEFDSFDGGTLHFTSVDAPAANTPYLVVPTATSLALSADKSIATTPAALNTTVGGIDFIGTMAATSIPASSSDPAEYSYYAYNNGEFVKIVTAAATLPAFRAYFKVLNSAITSAPALNVIFDDAEVTGISQIEEIAVKMQNVFDLQGRRVAQPTKGLYIVNGKKVVIK